MYPFSPQTPFPSRLPSNPVRPHRWQPTRLPPSLGFSRQEHRSGWPFPSPMHESEKWKWSHLVSPTLRDPMDCSLPASSVHGIFQARVLEWGAIAFSTCESTYKKNNNFQIRIFDDNYNSIVHSSQELIKSKYPSVEDWFDICWHIYAWNIL